MIADREQLIKEAVNALDQHDRVWQKTSNRPLPDRGVSAALRALLAFENAYAPTGDEPQALVSTCDDTTLKCELGEDCDGRCNEIAGETPGLISCPCGWSRIGLFHQLHEHQRSHESEQQGEPSDDLRDAIDHIQGAIAFQDAINPEAVRVVIHAALRATGVMPAQKEEGRGA